MYRHQQVLEGCSKRKIEHVCCRVHCRNQRIECSPIFGFMRRFQNVGFLDVFATPHTKQKLSKNQSDRHHALSRNYIRQRYAHQPANRVIDISAIISHKGKINKSGARYRHA